MTRDEGQDQKLLITEVPEKGRGGRGENQSKAHECAFAIGDLSTAGVLRVREAHPSLKMTG